MKKAATNTTRIEPTPGRVLVRWTDDLAKSTTIIIPDVAKQSSNIAEVVHVGNPRPTIPNDQRPNINVGDLVILTGNYTSREVKIGDERFVIVDFEHILGIVRKE